MAIHIARFSSEEAYGLLHVQPQSYAGINHASISHTYVLPASPAGLVCGIGARQDSTLLTRLGIILEVSKFTM